MTDPRRPWAKWAVLAAAAMQLVALTMTLRDYRISVGAGIYSPAELERYILAMRTTLLLQSMSAAALLGCFLIAVLARSRQSQKRMETVLLMMLSAALGVWLWFHHESPGICAVLGVLIAVFLSGAVLSFVTSRRSGK